jgi:N-acetylglucosaminyldiphosphoundecaprenol N-acetyl-beta-D-mannosaminyltransferase
MPILAVGAAFDFFAGNLAQAPKIMQDTGLEWLFRFIQEPRRLWYRYTVLNPLYLWNIFQQRSGLKDFSPSMPDGNEKVESFG